MIGKEISIIGILGPAGTFSENAARRWIDGKMGRIPIQTNERTGESPVGQTDDKSEYELKYFDDIADIVYELGAGIDIGIVPVENSTQGSVEVTLDSLLVEKRTIIGEIIIPVRHCLLATGDIGDIATIVSHPQPLAQCRHFIRENFKGVEVHSTLSTAHGAKMAAQSNSTASIGPVGLAKRYGLQVLRCDIQDIADNYTRFLVLTHEKDRSRFEMPISDSTGVRYKTSIIIYLQQDHPGALYETLGEFAKRNINLTRIESRPSKKVAWGYRFYIDLEGSINDDTVSDALAAIQHLIDEIHILGSYPAAVV